MNAPEASSTPLEREQQHALNERSGNLRFVPVRNDSSTEAVVPLIDLKNIFAKQLPKMPKEYIVRLVLDRFHESLACEFEREVVGGITYRVHAEQSFAEIAFCAVSASHQVQGYGTRLMNQLKERAKREGIQYLLTYADNHAIGYFRKQGFQKQVTMKRGRWLGFIKDYDGGTLMECNIDPSVDYLSIRFFAEQQRAAVEKKISTLTKSYITHPGIEKRARSWQDIPGLGESSWQPTTIECCLHGQPQPMSRCLLNVFKAIQTHEDAWPFQHSVSIADAPDYYQVIKDPIHLSLIGRRLQDTGVPYYMSAEQLLADVCRMCENCRLYNSEETAYWDCAVRLEAYARSQCAEIKQTRREASKSARWT